MNFDQSLTCKLAQEQACIAAYTSYDEITLQARRKHQALAEGLRMLISIRKQVRKANAAAQGANNVSWIN